MMDMDPVSSMSLNPINHVTQLIKIIILQLLESPNHRRQNQMGGGLWSIEKLTSVQPQSKLQLLDCQMSDFMLPLVHCHAPTTVLRPGSIVVPPWSCEAGASIAT